MTSLRKQQIKNVSDLSLFDTSDPSNPIALILPKPSAVVLQAGIEEVLNETRNPLGERVVDSTNIDANQPSMQMTFPSITPQLIYMRLGKKPKSGSLSFPSEQTILISSANRVYSGALAGQSGFGMAADQAESKAWRLDDDGLVVELSRVATASFADANDTFSQGANGAYNFASSLIGSTVFYSFPFSSTGIETGEEEYDTFKLSLTFVNRQLWQGRINFPSCQINLATGDINIGQQLQITARSVYDGSSCQPITVQFLRNLKVAC